MRKIELTMSNHLFKGMLVLVCLALMSMPVSAFGDKPAPGSGSGSGCASLAPLTLSTATALPGINVGVFGRITNCSKGKVRYTLTVSAMSSCGQFTIVSSSDISLTAGQTKLFSIQYPVAADTCPGDLVVAVNVYAGSTLLAQQQETLTVE